MLKNSVQIFAHRGFSSQFPENTMSAFQAAQGLNVDGIELDVQLSKDGVPVIIHDLTLERTTNGSGYVRQSTVKELKQLSAGCQFSDSFINEKIPTLEEFLLWMSEHSFVLNIELKGFVQDRKEIIHSVTSLVKGSQLEKRIIFSSFDHRGLYDIKEKLPNIETAILAMEPLFEPQSYMEKVGASAYHFYAPTLLEDEVRELRKYLILRPFTVNHLEQMKNFIHWGVAGLFTDFPDRALNIKDL
ncbi:glycerophosphodiester phosphodiesterase [Alkalihalobacillus trypoxylicola]|uniref:Glycerophosphodiester phosphodiesterase n=1 Tax=Alkalihalobacillus trypoxylicola TaxID=519424 RepID=A0A162EFF1_9BACI|nr:glycerophosphodiester phosphodiesterase [Alkalihalobacillus trypoxylicola]